MSNLKIKLNHTPYSSTYKDEFKIWWFGDSNQLVYHYLAPFGVHNNMTFTEYVVLPKRLVNINFLKKIMNIM